MANRTLMWDVEPLSAQSSLCASSFPIENAKMAQSLVVSRRESINIQELPCCLGQGDEAGGRDVLAVDYFYI